MALLLFLPLSCCWKSLEFAAVSGGDCDAEFARVGYFLRCCLAAAAAAAASGRPNAAPDGRVRGFDDECEGAADAQPHRERSAAVGCRHEDGGCGFGDGCCEWQDFDADEVVVGGAAADYNYAAAECVLALLVCTEAPLGRRQRTAPFDGGDSAVRRLQAMG